MQVSEFSVTIIAVAAADAAGQARRADGRGNQAGSGGGVSNGGVAKRNAL